MADKLNLNINIIESHPNFAELTIIQPANVQEELVTIFIGHLNEIHYVSTKQESVSCIFHEDEEQPQSKCKFTT